jgi:hypothetical protein
MPLNYIKSVKHPPNTLYYILNNGDIKFRKNNTKYIHKKPDGVIRGVALAFDDLIHIYRLHQQGMKIKALCRQFGISYYYFKKIKNFFSEVLSDEIVDSNDNLEHNSYLVAGF